LIQWLITSCNVSRLYSEEHIIRQGYVISIELFLISLVFVGRLEFFILIS
jgi:hypothetical protein